MTVGEVELLMMEPDAIVEAIVMRGIDVIRTARVDRYIPAAQRRGVQMRDAWCVVPGCTQTVGLESDHIDGYANTRLTTIERLGRMCRFHHRLKTLYSWTLTRHRDGSWSFDPPPSAENASLFDDDVEDVDPDEKVEARCRTD